jgi:hypothetical protein
MVNKKLIGEEIVSEELLVINNYCIFNQILNRLELGFNVYLSEVVIENCLIENIQIHSAWFKKGFIFRNNIIKCNIDYQMGGHNFAPIIMENNIFMGFFNFFDCHFEGKVIVRNNIFQKGANLLGNRGKGYQNLFNNGIINENNIGNLSLDKCL